MPPAQSQPASTITENAPAKINLALHVTGRRADGYHLLESIVTFAGHGDRLFVSPAEVDTFSLSGRFAASLHDEATSLSNGNLVTKARDLLRAALKAQGHKAPPVSIHLEKNLPVASGIGGGSADAAAALRGLMRLWQADLPHATLADLCLSLGADVPMCLTGQPLFASGIGEDIRLLPDMPSFAMVLANPLQGVSTPEIFRRLENKTNPPVDAALPAGKSGWIDFLARQRNDLEPPARALLPEIGLLSSLLTRQGAALVRMSGSGATCYGIFQSMTEAENAAGKLRAERPDWYFQATATTGEDIS